jgi:hypothetical protein
MNGCWGFSGVSARVTFAIAAVLMLSSPSAAQDKARDPVDSALERFAYERVAKSSSQESEKIDAGYHDYKMAQERNRLWALVLLVATAVTAHALLLWRLGSSRPAHVVSGTGFIYIVFGTVVLVTLSDNKDQLTASMGIMGAIAGYLFGRMRPEQGGSSKANG